MIRAKKSRLLLYFLPNNVKKIPLPTFKTRKNTFQIYRCARPRTHARAGAKMAAGGCAPAGGCAGRKEKVRARALLRGQKAVAVQNFCSSILTSSFVRVFDSNLLLNLWKSHKHNTKRKTCLTNGNSKEYKPNRGTFYQQNHAKMIHINCH